MNEEMIKYFEEVHVKLTNIEILMQLNGELLTYLSNKLDKFIKQREKLEELIDWMDRHAPYGDEQEEKNMKQTKPYKFKNLIKDKADGK